MPRVAHFEIHADDPERASKFYSETFGWKFTKWEGPNEYYVIETGNKEEMGINGGMLRRLGNDPSIGQPVNAYVCTIWVDSVDEYVNKARQNGARVIVPKMPVQGIGYLVYCTDTEGNIIGIMSADKSAD